MASTDIIYGITMIEAGVSRVVPVDLRELTWFLNFHPSPPLWKTKKFNRSNFMFFF
jgi:hypothetical protein